MKQVLPLSKSPIETYQGSSFVSRILLNFPETSNIYFNRYINLECADTTTFNDILLELADITPADFNVSGILELRRIYMKDFQENNLIDFLKTQIDQGNYISCYNIDEFYLSYSEKYQKLHFYHDCYIYGYSDECFFIHAFSNLKMSEVEVPMKSFLDSIYKVDDIIAELNFIKPTLNQYIDINLSEIYKNLSKYYYSEGQNIYGFNCIFGFSTYEAMRKNIENYQATCPKKLDLRTFRCFWEHKKIMKERILRLKDMIPLDPQCEKLITQMETQSQRMFLLCIMYEQSQRKNILTRIRNNFESVYQMDQVFTPLFLSELEPYK